MGACLGATTKEPKTTLVIREENEVTEKAVTNENITKRYCETFFALKDFITKPFDFSKAFDEYEAKLKDVRSIEMTLFTLLKTLQTFVCVISTFEVHKNAKNMPLYQCFFQSL